MASCFHRGLLITGLMAWSASIASAQTMLQNDVVLGLSLQGPTISLEVARGDLEPDGGEWVVDLLWDEPYIQSVEFDNLNGISHNSQGNLLGVNFGASDDTGGSIVSFSTCEIPGSDQLIGDTLGLGGSGLTSSRLGGLSVSPNNMQIAVTGYGSQRVIVFDYVAGDCLGSGASLSGGRESDALLSPFDTQGTSWLDNRYVLAFSAGGQLFQVDATTMTSNVIAELPTGGGSEVNRSESTDVEYNPAVSPYVYASYAGFDRDTRETTDRIYILDPRTQFSLVKEIDLADSRIDSLREIALDANGNLFLAQRNSNVQFIADADQPETLVDNSSVTWYESFNSSGFLGIDVAIDLPIVEIELDGDYNENGELDAQDLDWQAEVALGLREYDEKYDETGDGQVTEADRRVWLAELRKTWVGDSNLDSEFNTGDVVSVLSEGKYETDETAGWAQGDWTGDLRFGSGDVIAALAAGGYEEGRFPGTDEGIRAVPEPNSSVLALLALIPAFLLRRCRRSSR